MSWSKLGGIFLLLSMACWLAIAWSIGWQFVVALLGVMLFFLTLVCADQDKKEDKKDEP